MRSVYFMEICALLYILMHLVYMNLYKYINKFNKSWMDKLAKIKTALSQYCLHHSLSKITFAIFSAFAPLPNRQRENMKLW